MAADALVDSGTGLGAPDREHPGQRGRHLKNAAWYVLFTLLSLVILFPVWITLVRALSAPLDYITQ